MLDRNGGLTARLVPLGERIGHWVRLITVCAGMLLLTAASAPAAQQVQDLLGCCVCRGDVNGEPNSSKSCESSMSVVACETKCKNSGASSLVYGNGQSCATGCAGLATQSLSK